MDKPKVLIADSISPKGIESLESGGELLVDLKLGLKEKDLVAIAAEYSAIVVRSQTKITADVIQAAKRLKVVGRAGVGVDNVDVDAATRRGVIVMNTPGGNTVSTAEHAFSLLVSIARNIPQAHASVKAGKWDRKSFEGVELHGKTIGIFGMGRIGTEVARRVIAFGMRAIAYDPYLSPSRARSLQVELFDDLDQVLAQSDFVTMHMPLTAETEHLINSERIAKMRRGARIVNCARGGLIDEKALFAALQSGQIAAAALDVYETEPPPAEFPLRTLPNVVFTPHLGASTAEAQESVGIEIAEAIRSVLLEGVIRNAVNVPNIDAKTLAVIAPYLAFGEKLGRFLRQIAPKRCETLSINYSGKVNEFETSPISRYILKGFLEEAGGGEVNPVNATSFAQTLGLKTAETKDSASGEFTDLVDLQAVGHGETVSVAGTFIGSSPRIVRINGRHVEARSVGVLLLLENHDVPGIVGQIGTVLGAHAVNIANMSLSRDHRGGEVLTVLNLDSVPDEAIIESILSNPNIRSAKVVRL
ncbi:MAG: phosphoglycerate dehydrogenase [Verrucomicrobia bacterium]|nr:phosphoglycerate dehydrogenase [Verrucomicrobiota bacterium]MBV9130377.1 phosphoglycerate dehydrogenase [Verrucomicrobiota bacterium]MBV9644779.1 phosphoglycerate dehydrogenase [Verrucomicrobiota bacterium]